MESISEVGGTAHGHAIILSTLRKKECHANWCSDAAMIEEPERSFVPGTSVYLKDSTDDTQTCSPANETLQQSHAK